MSSNRQHTWLDSIIDSPVLDRLAARVGTDNHTVVNGSRGSSTTLLVGAMAVRTERLVMLVVAHPDDADDALDDLELFNDSQCHLECKRFAALEVLPGETAVSLELLGERLSVIEWLENADSRRPGVLVAPVHALMQSVPKAEAVGKMSLTIQTGDMLSIGQLLEWLTGAGYERIDVVEQPGQFASRGGIVDIYPSGGVVNTAGNGDNANGEAAAIPGAGVAGPVRFDFFGDTVDSIHGVDPDTMGSGQRVQRVQLIGASAEAIQSDEDTTNLIAMLPDNAVVVLHEMMELSEQARGYYERLTNPRGIYPPQAIFKSLCDRPHLEVNQYGSGASGSSGEHETVRLPVATLEAFDTHAVEAVRGLISLAGENSGDDSGGSGGVIVMCQKEAERDRLRELIREQAPGTPTPGMEKKITIEVGYLHRGFVWEGGEGEKPLHVIPHHELFHRYHVRRRVRALGTGAAGGGRAGDAFFDLDVGDYVVHVDHGIARFAGLKSLRRGGKNEEYLTLEFAQDALLHVPATQIELVQKYVGGFHGRPPLSQLGGKRWSKQKEQVAEAVKDLAAELLRVQAARASMPGITYPTDTAWQHKFEAEFPYDETEDQLAAIAQVKNDMSGHQPMDRLICGDVGFGKTEVAVRGTFKAVEYGKQVAVLVPTTVLAEQHERTFRERMADYPFRVESISRFKTGAETGRVLKDLEHGEVDVIIGTHRLLSGDVKFADLGLVIIDEEQRFGVEHKHKLMRLRLMVDVLTLSATPIPRTLHMSMLGLRDISSLTTPPLDRRAIMTEVIPYNEQRIEQAIVRELNRDGQVFFVHNRVHDIESVAASILKLVPTARIAVGHGQMPGHELEAVMLRFMQRKVDVLVCTTIIESGLDIPTANTIFINGADRFGLADLHQLRGRVGRYKHRAYCYLLMPQGPPGDGHSMATTPRDRAILNARCRFQDRHARP